MQQFNFRYIHVVYIIVCMTVYRWVYTFNVLNRFDTLSYASQIPIKAFCGIPVYTFHAGISARQRARESVARRKILQRSTVLNFHALRWVYTFDAVKRFDTLSYASQMRIKAFCGVSVYTFHADISARQRARESVARRKMLQSSTVLNFHALRQRTQAIQPIIYRCHELILQRIDLAITSESSHWTISSWRRSRKAHVIAVKMQS